MLFMTLTANDCACIRDACCYLDRLWDSLLGVTPAVTKHAHKGGHMDIAKKKLQLQHGTCIDISYIAELAAMGGATLTDERIREALQTLQGDQ